jgi:predicted DNA-binding transcriptional regulator AlpA
MQVISLMNESKKHMVSQCQLVGQMYTIERIIRIDEMMQLLRVSRSTLYRRVKSGSFIKPVVINNKTKGWKQSDYERWLSQF